MSYTPRSGQDVRVVYNSETGFYEVQQVRVRRAAGFTDANDLGSILDLNEEGWEVRSSWNTPSGALLELFALTIQEEPLIRSIDLGPTPLSSATIARVRDLMLAFTL